MPWGYISSNRKTMWNKETANNIVKYIQRSFQKMKLKTTQRTNSFADTLLMLYIISWYIVVRTAVNMYITDCKRLRYIQCNRLNGVLWNVLLMLFSISLKLLPNEHFYSLSTLWSHNATVATMPLLSLSASLFIVSILRMATQIHICQVPVTYVRICILPFLLH